MQNQSQSIYQRKVQKVKMQMQKMYKKERITAEECFAKYFHENCKIHPESPFDHCSQYKITIGKNKYQLCLKDDELKQLISVSFDIIDELKNIYGSGFHYNNLMKSLDDYDVIDTNDGVYDIFGDLWNKKFHTDEMKRSFERIMHMRKIDEHCVRRLRKIIVFSYMAMAGEYELHGYDATKEYLYILITSLMIICYT